MNIVVSAVVLQDSEGRVLTCRKAGTELFQFPGGKWEPGEDARAAAVRETHEELGTELDPDALDLVGVFTAPAANEAGFTVTAHVFSAPLGEHTPAPAAEIAELRYFSLDAAAHTDSAEYAVLAPLLRDVVFPALDC